MIRLIAAIDDERGIGKDGSIPWHIPKDLENFKRLTTHYGSTVVMGRTTYESIGRPLLDRNNIVVSSSLHDGPGYTVVQDLNNYMQTAQEDVWIIGGADIYAQALQYAGRLYITHVEGAYGCERFFPDFEATFLLGQQSPQQHQNGYTFKFAVYKRR